MNELKLDIFEIKTESYAEKDFDLIVDLGEVDLRGQIVNVSGVKVKGKASNTSTGILLKANVFGDLTLSCTRCVEKFIHPLNISIEEFYSFSEEDEERKLDNDKIDIGSLIIEAIALNLDMKILCKQDCSGLCPKCGQNLNQEQCRCENEPVDIRWNKLEELKAKYKKSEENTKKD